MTMQTASPGRAAEGADYRMTQAWQWLCEQRTQAPDQADVWDIRWQNLNTGAGWLTDLTARVLRGEYSLTPLQMHGKGKERKAVWSAQDALVLKWAALSLQHQLPLHPSCEHVKGHGGGKQSIEKLHTLLTAPADPGEKKTDAAAASTSGTSDSPDTREYKWVCRTDIRGYYRNISKQTLKNQVQQHVRNPVLRDLVQQYIHYTVEDGGIFHTPEKGISRGCPLSPLMGALHLYDMDAHFSQQPSIHYARYMDDVIILAKSRWSLRKHTKRLMQWFSEYGFEAHPDKTQIGRIKKGFDWMGAWLTSDGVTDIAPRAKANHREKVRRLYEQLARLPLWKRKSAAPKVNARVSTYRKRWNIWVKSMIAKRLTPASQEPGFSGGDKPTIPNPPASALRANASLHACLTGALLSACIQPTYATSMPAVVVPQGTAIGSPVGNVIGGPTLPNSNIVQVPLNKTAVSGYAWGHLAASNGTIVGTTTRSGSNTTYVPSGATIVTTPAGDACGIGISGSITAVSSFPAATVGGSGTSSSSATPARGGGTGTSGSANIKLCGNTSCDGEVAYIVAKPQISLVYTGRGHGVCPAGTVVGTLCLDGYGTSNNGTPSGTNLGACTISGDTVTLAGSIASPDPAICSLTVDPSNGTPTIPDIQPGQTAGSAKGSILSIGEQVTITSGCTASTGDTNVQTQGTYVTTGADFSTAAGFDASTNTYLGLMTAKNPKATLGSVVSAADLWTETASGPSPQTTTLMPVVLLGGSAPTPGRGNVVMTVSAVAR